MTGQDWKTLQEMNKTPLSQACKALLDKPWEGGLYLVQALRETLENNYPPEPRHMWKMAWTVWATTSDLLDSFLFKNPKAVYQVLTKNEEEEITDNEILEQMKKEKSREDKLLCLLDEVQSILELNGYNLSLVYPTTG